MSELPGCPMPQASFPFTRIRVFSICNNGVFFLLLHAGTEPTIAGWGPPATQRWARMQSQPAKDGLWGVVK